MSTETDFRAILTGHAALTALVSTRIYPLAAPEGASFPFVAYRRGQDEPQFDLDNVEVGRTVKMQIDIVPTDYANAIAIGAAIEEAFAVDRDWTLDDEEDQDYSVGGGSEEVIRGRRLTFSRWVNAE